MNVELHARRIDGEVASIALAKNCVNAITFLWKRCCEIIAIAYSYAQLRVDDFVFCSRGCDQRSVSIHHSFGGSWPVTLDSIDRESLESANDFLFAEEKRGQESS